MKNLIQRQSVLIIGLLLAVQVQASQIEFRADTTSIAVGESLELSIFATGFNKDENSADNEELAGGIIDFSLSSLSFLSINDVEVDSFWNFEPEKGELKGSNWEDIGFDILNKEPLNGDGLIATVSVTGLSAGVTALTLLDSSQLFNTVAELAPTYGSIDITVSAVPVPAAVWFMGSALVGLIGLRRKPL